MTKALQQNLGTGRRKASSARVFLRKGNGNIIINKRSLEEYFGRQTARMIVKQPIALIPEARQFDFYITVKGGGSSGQAGAIRHGITRALIKHEQEHDLNANQSSGDEGGEGGESGGTWHRALRRAGYVTRDSREVEPKKVGRPKARRAKQFSKR